VPVEHSPANLRNLRELLERTEVPWAAGRELPPLALVNVMVAEIDWPRARPIVERIDAALSERRAQPEPDGGWLPDPA